MKHARDDDARSRARRWPTVLVLMTAAMSAFSFVPDHEGVVAGLRLASIVPLLAALVLVGVGMRRHRPGPGVATGR